MENASKALIIAGAILLAILLISLGIMVFNKAQDISDGGQIDQAEVSTYNSKFAKYEGTNVSGSQVKALVGEINTNNTTDKNNRVVRHIALDVDNSIITQTTGTGTDANYPTYLTSKVSSSAKYTIAVTGYDSKGYITKIKITKNS